MQQRHTQLKRIAAAVLAVGALAAAIPATAVAGGAGPAQMLSEPGGGGTGH